jgi:hypothetical protein
MESSGEIDAVALRNKYLSGLTIPVHDDPDEDAVEERQIDCLLDGIERDGISLIYERFGRGLGNSMIHFCANSEKLLTVLLHLGINVNELGSDYYTPLFYCLNRSRVNIKALKVLLQAGADVRYEDVFKKTILDYLHLSLPTSQEILPLLLQYGANKIPKRWRDPKGLPTRDSEVLKNKGITILNLIVLASPIYFPRVLKQNVWLTRDVLIKLKTFLL